MKTKKLSAKQWVKLVEAARKGNEKAFEEICRQKSSYILFVCNNVLHNWQDAEDATQEVLIALQIKIKTLKIPEAFPTWLNRLSYTTSMRMRQNQMKNQYIASLDESDMEFQDFSIDALPAELLETKESCNQVMNAVKSLPINYRMALIFHYYDDLSVKDIADVMSVSESAVKNYLFRGRIALKVKLESKAPTKKSFPKYTTLSAMLPLVFESTDMLIATQRSVNILQAMSIPLAASGAVGLGATASAASILKVAGGIVASGAMAATVIVAGGSNDTYTSSPQTAYIAPIYSLGEIPGSPDTEQSYIESAPQLSQSTSVPGEERSKSGSSRPKTNGTAIMGQIVLNSLGANTYFSAEGITVQLISLGNPSCALYTTKTLSGEYAGWYMFENLEPGAYRIKILLPSYFHVASNNDNTLENGYLSYKGNTIFSLEAGEPSTANLSVTQTGNITGKIITEQAGLENELGGMVVKLYNAQNHLLMQTETSADGSYALYYPPIAQAGNFTLRYSIPANLGVTLSEQKVSCHFTPGQAKTIDDITAKDNAPPALQIKSNLDNGSQDRTTTFEITATDTGPVEIVWQLFIDSDLLAVGYGLTPGNQLDLIPAGEYTLTVTATDRVGNTRTAQTIIRLG